MGFLWFGRRDEEDKRHKDHHRMLKESVDGMKTEFSKAGKWIEHLNTQDAAHTDSVEELLERVAGLEKDISEIKEMVSFFGPSLFKQRQTAVHKQTGVGVVQTRVQTGVYNEFFGSLTTMERAIVWVLINTEMKLSCEDIAALLGKSRSTIRGQMNTIRQKSGGLIQEVIEGTGKKRVFIPSEMKETLLRKMKIQQGKKAEKQVKEKVRVTRAK